MVEAEDAEIIQAIDLEQQVDLEVLEVVASVEQSMWRLHYWSSAS